MKTVKLNLKNIKNVLSRSEMKKIMAGSGVTVICPSGYVICNCSPGGVNSVTCIPAGAECCKAA